MKTMGLFIVLANALMAAPANYVIQSSATARLELGVEKTGLFSGKKHVFTFEKYKGALQFDAAAPEQSRVELIIESASILCHDTWVNMKDLKSVTEWALKEMLMVDRNPTMTFRSTGIRKRADGRFDVDGMLTIRGTPKPVNVVTTLHQDSDAKLTLEGTSIIRMTDWGMKPPTAALGAIGTKAEMPFKFNVTAEP